MGYVGWPIFSHVKLLFLTNGNLDTLEPMCIHVSRKKTVPYVLTWTAEEKAVNK